MGFLLKTGIDVIQKIQSKDSSVKYKNISFTASLIVKRMLFFYSDLLIDFSQILGLAFVNTWGDI